MLKQCPGRFPSQILMLFFFASDCPQVQCVEQYVAQQTDELTLEPTEIINVIRKTNEGKNVEKMLLNLGFCILSILVME